MTAEKFLDKDLLQWYGAKVDSTMFMLWRLPMLIKVRIKIWLKNKQQFVNARKPGSREPGRLVMMFNDDFTPMDFVVEILESIFFKSQAEAEAIMLKVHHEEKAVVGTYSYDIAKSKSGESDGKPVRRSFR